MLLKSSFFFFSSQTASLLFGFFDYILSSSVGLTCKMYSLFPLPLSQVRSSSSSVGLTCKMYSLFPLPLSQVRSSSSSVGLTCKMYSLFPLPLSQVRSSSSSVGLTCKMFYFISSSSHFSSLSISRGTSTLLLAFPPTKSFFYLSCSFSLFPPLS